MKNNIHLHSYTQSHQKVIQEMQIVRTNAQVAITEEHKKIVNENNKNAPILNEAFEGVMEIGKKFSNDGMDRRLLQARNPIEFENYQKLRGTAKAISNTSENLMIQLFGSKTKPGEIGKEITLSTPDCMISELNENIKDSQKLLEVLSSIHNNAMENPNDVNDEKCPKIPQEDVKLLIKEEEKEEGNELLFKDFKKVIKDGDIYDYIQPFIIKTNSDKLYVAKNLNICMERLAYLKLKMDAKIKTCELAIKKLESIKKKHGSNYKLTGEAWKATCLDIERKLSAKPDKNVGKNKNGNTPMLSQEQNENSFISQHDERISTTETKKKNEKEDVFNLLSSPKDNDLICQWKKNLNDVKDRLSNNLFYAIDHVDNDNISTVKNMQSNALMRNDKNEIVFRPEGFGSTYAARAFANLAPQEEIEVAPIKIVADYAAERAERKHVGNFEFSFNEMTNGNIYVAIGTDQIHAMIHKIQKNPFRETSSINNIKIEVDPEEVLISRKRDANILKTLQKFDGKDPGNLYFEENSTIKYALRDRAKFLNKNGQMIVEGKIKHIEKHLKKLNEKSAQYDEKILSEIKFQSMFEEGYIPDVPKDEKYITKNTEDEVNYNNSRKYKDLVSNENKKNERKLQALEKTLDKKSAQAIKEINDHVLSAHKNEDSIIKCKNDKIELVTLLVNNKTLSEYLAAPKYTPIT